MLDGVALGLANGELMFFVELVDNEPGGDGTRVYVHVANEERAAHGQDLDDPQGPQPVEVVPHPNEVVPVLARALILGLLAELLE